MLTAAGRLPIAAAGCDIDALMAGRRKAREELAVFCSTQNEVLPFMLRRAISLYRREERGTDETLAELHDDEQVGTNGFSAKARGKDQKGLFPPALFSTDLHSMGPVRAGRARIMFETVVDIKQPQRDLYIEKAQTTSTALDFLARAGI